MLELSLVMPMVMAPCSRARSSTRLVSVDSPGLRNGHDQGIAIVDPRLVQRGDRGAARETGMPVVISIR